MIDDKTLESILFMSKLDVDENVREKFRSQIDSVITYFEILKEVDTESVTSSAEEAVGMDELRMDEKKESFSTAILKSFAIHFMDGYFAVPRIIEKRKAEEK